MGTDEEGPDMKIDPNPEDDNDSDLDGLYVGRTRTAPSFGFRTAPLLYVR